MSDEGEWGPWVEHDGAGCEILPPRTIEVWLLRYSGLIAPLGDEPVYPSSPGWFWRWKRVRTGWFSSELRRVCDQPEYAPIIRYRIRRPRALRQLIELAENPPALPEGVDA